MLAVKLITKCANSAFKCMVFLLVVNATEFSALYNTVTYRAVQ